MSGAIPLLPHMLSCFSQGQLYLFIFTFTCHTKT